VGAAIVTLKDIERAREQLGDAVYLTPCTPTEHFIAESGAGELHFKMENLQRTGSFKARGALNKLLSLSPEERARGVVAASAGNHAQGVAYHAGRLGISATIAMPERTPLIKVASTRGFGAKVVLAGANFDEAMGEAKGIEQREKRVFVHPFDDPAVVAGQGTVGLELLEQNPHLDVVVVPIGGGGLASGVGCALKETNPRVKVIGVEAAAIASARASRDAKAVVEVPAAATLADGIAVKRPSALTFEMIERYVDDIVTVSEEEIANAILLLLEREKTVVEGAGAVGLAALINGRIPAAKGRKVALVLSGGNIDVNLISRIIERGLVQDGRLVRMRVTVPDRPGSLARFTAALAEQQANVVEIHHDREFGRSALSEVEVHVTLEARGREHVEELRKALREKGWQVHEQGEEKR
jgi:threonine dehydratase